MVKTGMQLKSNQRRYPRTSSVARVQKRRRASVPAMLPQKKVFDVPSFDCKAGANLLQWNCISKVPAGTANNRRIGNTIRITDVHFRGHLVVPDTGSQTIRLVLIHDRAAAGATNIQLSDIYAALPANNAMEIVSQRNMDNISRFEVLSDQTFNMGLYSGTVTGQDERLVEVHKTGLNIKATYVTGDMTDPLDASANRTSAIYLVSSLEDVAETTLLTGNTRVKYYDS